MYVCMYVCVRLWISPHLQQREQQSFAQILKLVEQAVVVVVETAHWTLVLGAEEVPALLQKALVTASD